MTDRYISDECSRYKYVMENIKDVIWEVDTNLVFNFISPTIKGLTGYEPEEVIGRCLLDFLTAESKEYILAQLNNKMNSTDENGENMPLYDVEFICKNGRPVWCEVCAKPIKNDGKLNCYIGTTRDISEKKIYEKKLKEMLKEQKQINEQLEDMAIYDTLTGAFNRRKFEYFIGLEIEKMENCGNPFSICILDVDDFKKINDLNGHNKGDLVLIDITSLIKNTIRKTDKLFRWGGDEFIIIFSDINLNNAYKVANKLRKTIESHKFSIDGKKATVSMGVGSYYTKENLDQFIIRIDEALLRAKNNGKNIVEQG